MRKNTKEIKTLEVLEACKTLGKMGAEITLEDERFGVAIVKPENGVDFKTISNCLVILRDADFKQLEFVMACKDKKVTPKCEFKLSDGETYFVLPGKEDVVNINWESFGKVYPGANYKFGMRNTCCDGIADLLNKEIAKLNKAKEDAEKAHKAAEDAKKAAEEAEEIRKRKAIWDF